MPSSKKNPSDGESTASYVYDVCKNGEEVDGYLGVCGADAN